MDTRSCKNSYVSNLQTVTQALLLFRNSIVMLISCNSYVLAFFDKMSNAMLITCLSSSVGR